MISAHSNAQRLVDKMQAQIERLQNFTIPLQAAGVVVRDASVKRFRSNTWAPDAPSTIAAKGSSRPGIDTGRLRQSIQVSPPSPTSVTISTDVKDARWFQEGTGVFAGHSAWTIRPKSKKALAFTIGGQTYVRRSVTMQGQPPRPFLDSTLLDEVRPKLAAIFETWIMRGVVP